MIVACSVTGVVSGSLNVGGLVGKNFSGTIIASYSMGRVTSDSGSAGGLDGNNLRAEGPPATATGIPRPPAIQRAPTARAR